MKNTETHPTPVTVIFTQAQHKRLTAAAKIVNRSTGHKITVEDLVVSGAMSLLDFSASPRAAGAEAIASSVESYATDRATFAEPEYGEDALQSSKWNT